MCGFSASAFFALFPCFRINRAARGAIHRGADFGGRLGRHFERKIGCVSMASTLGAAMRLRRDGIMRICAAHRAFKNQRNWIAGRTYDAVHCTSLPIQFRLIGHRERC